MTTRKYLVLPPHTPEVHAALEAVRDLLEGVDTSTEEGAAYAKSLLREHGLPEEMIYISGHQPKELSPAATAWAERVLREDGLIP